MKLLELKLLKIKTFTLAAAGFALLSSSALALDFQYSFVNTLGNVGSPADVITGRILGLNDNSLNFQPVTVTLDSVSPSISSPFTAPYQWTDSGVFAVSGGVLSGISWSSNDGTFAINIDTANAPFIATSSAGQLFSKYYLGGQEGSLSITPLSSVPDGGSTMLLFGLSLAGLVWAGRKLA